MEENVALDTSKQKQFVKSIRGIKKLIKKAGDVPEIAVPKDQDERKSKRKRPERGLVYLSHIPHGFYEHEMTQYFRQFGAVSNVRVIRSKRTGNSKGFAFVEFKQPEVAEIVAETMNNYLMGKRLLKAAYVPPEKQRSKAMRKHWSRLHNPTNTERLKQKKAYNENKDKPGELARARRTLATYKKNIKKLSDIGINYDFFSPVDVPEELKENIVVNKGVGEIEVGNKGNKQSKETKSLPAKKDTKEVKQVDSKKGSKKIPEPVVNKKVSKKIPEPVVNKKEQKKKQLKLKELGGACVKAPENFIKIQQEGGSESDSSADFDSDDYSKMLADDSDADSNDAEDSGDDDAEQVSDDDEQESDDDEEGSDDDGSDEFEITGSDDDESDVNESEDEEQVIPIKKGKGKGSIAPPVPVQTKKQVKPAKQASKAPQQKQSKTSENKVVVQQKGPKAPVVQKSPVVQKGRAQQKSQKEPKAPELAKRKAPPKNAESPKKSKFEKQTSQPMKKQFKKKK